ncbi:MAG: hypothetical protein Q8K85_21795, partial [Hyphomicrobium sp.]|nr:hypothetical protein [Hyphomicrobium sp.]
MFQFIEPTAPASFAVLYFSLHCFIVSALAGWARANTDSAATPASILYALDIVSSLVDCGARSLITSATGEAMNGGGQALSLPNETQT